MIDERFEYLLAKYMHPYVNAAKGVVWSVDIFEEVPERLAGELFDYLMDFAVKRVGTQVVVGISDKHLLRFVPKIPRQDLSLANIV